MVAFERDAPEERAATKERAAPEERAAVLLVPPSVVATGD